MPEKNWRCLSPRKKGLLAISTAAAAKPSDNAFASSNSRWIPNAIVASIRLRDLDRRARADHAMGNFDGEENLIQNRHE